jgi:hypothetical protein
MTQLEPQTQIVQDISNKFRRDVASLIMRTLDISETMVGAEASVMIILTGLAVAGPRFEKSRRDVPNGVFLEMVDHVTTMAKLERQ